jgi:hypothetical protein
MILLVMVGCGGEEPGSDELWDNPGAENTASRAAHEALAWCRDAWQADAHVVSVFRLPDTSWSVVTFSETDPDSICAWSAYISLDVEPTGEISASSEYDPGWTYDASDAMTGWAYDSDAAMADLGLSEHDFFWLTPAGHRRQVDDADALAGLDDDVPVILAAEGMSGPEYFLLDGRTGERLD